MVQLLTTHVALGQMHFFHDEKLEGMGWPRNPVLILPLVQLPFIKGEALTSLVQDSSLSWGERLP